MTPNPQQTASLLSSMLFGYLDATVWKAYKAPQLPLSELPPLCDSDHSKHLVRAAFPHLDPFAEEGSMAKNKASRKQKRSRRPLFFAVLKVFRKQVATVTLLLLDNFATLLSPYGLKQLLEYMGNGGKGATVKPWVWIASVRMSIP